MAYFGLRALAAARLPVLPDEAYYWTWASDLSLSYFDHPPGVAVAIAGGRAVLGPGVAGLRAPSFLATLLLVFASAHTAERLSVSKGGSAASQTLLLLIGAPMFAWVFLVGTPDVFLASALAVGVAALARVLGPDEVRKDRGLAGVLAPLSFAAATLFKHAGGVVALGVVLGGCSSRAGRAALRQPEMLAGLGLAAVGVGLWTTHDLFGGGAYGFQWARVHSGESRVFEALPLLLGALILTSSPLGCVLLGVALWRGLGSDGSPLERVLASGALGLLVLCGYAAGLGSGEVHWVFPGFVVLAPVIGAHLATWPGRLGQRLRQSNLAFAVLGTLLVAHAAQPWVLGHPAPRKDPSLRGVGFRKVTHAAGALAREMRAKAVVTRSYQLASLLRFHLSDEIPVVELGLDRPSQYDRWSRLPLCSGDRVVALISSDQDISELDLWVSPRPPPRSLIRRHGEAELGRLRLLSGRWTANAQGVSCSEVDLER